VVTALKQFGEDVELAPKNAYVSVRRKKQFALIQPSTKTRLDIGINLKDVEPEDRLEKSGSFNAMCSHRVRIESVEDINPELISWLKAAYEQAK
jgi:predicted transport protein